MYFKNREKPNSFDIKIKTVTHKFKISIQAMTAIPFVYVTYCIIKYCLNENLSLSPVWFVTTLTFMRNF